MIENLLNVLNTRWLKSKEVKWKVGLKKLPRMQPRQKSTQRQKEMKLKGLWDKKLQQLLIGYPKRYNKEKEESDFLKR